MIYRNRPEQVAYPRYCVQAILPDEASITGFASDLEVLVGVDAACFIGPEGARILATTFDEIGVLGRVLHAARQIGTEGVFLQRVQESLWADKVFVKVPVGVDKALKLRVAELLHRHGGVGLAYFGRFSLEKILPESLVDLPPLEIRGPALEESMASLEADGVSFDRDLRSAVELLPEADESWNVQFAQLEAVLAELKERGEHALSLSQEGNVDQARFVWADVGPLGDVAVSLVRCLDGDGRALVAKTNAVAWEELWTRLNARARLARARAQAAGPGIA